MIPNSNLITKSLDNETWIRRISMGWYQKQIWDKIQASQEMFKNNNDIQYP